MYEISDLEPKVKAGAKLLDNLEPGWFQVFNAHKLANLNAADGYNDVLGNVFGSYYEGLSELELCTVSMVVEHGFDLEYVTISQYNSDSNPWNDLTALWMEEIVDRQENGIPNGQD